MPEPGGQAAAAPRFRNRVRRIAARLGYRPASRSEPLLRLAELGLAPRSVLHVGANTGQEVGAYRAARLERAILVEPLPGPFATLSRRARGLPGFTAVQALCAEAEGGEHLFHVASNGGESSSLLRPRGHLTAHPEVRFEEHLRLEGTTVDALLGALGGEVPELLVLDVQGAEARVLDGAAGSLPRFRSLWIEVGYGGLYEGDTPLEAMLDRLRGVGFRLAVLRMTPQGWGDALLLRADLLPGRR